MPSIPLTNTARRLSVPHTVPLSACPGRQPASDDDLAAVPAEWKRLSPHPLRQMQARAFAENSGTRPPNRTYRTGQARDAPPDDRGDDAPAFSWHS